MNAAEKRAGLLSDVRWYLERDLKPEPYHVRLLVPELADALPKGNAQPKASG